MNLNHAYCPRCEDLAAEVVWLKDQLSGGVSVERMGRLMNLGFTAHMSRIALVLLAKAGKTLSSAAIADAIPALDPVRDRDEPRLVYVYISRLRKRLGRDAIETKWATGYRLTEFGARCIRDALGDLAP